MTQTLVGARAGSCTLYQVEDDLQAWVNTLDGVDQESTRQEILQEIGQAVRQAREKRDAVAGFLRHCAAQEEFADAEIQRIETRKAFIVRVRRELEAHLIHVVDEYAAPDRRGVKRLEGNVSSLRVQKKPDSVTVYDDQALPVAWKDVILTMPAFVWEALLGRLDLEERARFEGRIKRKEFRPDKRALAPELKKGVEIPGADLNFGDLRLVIE
jgi:hypothetical protein